MQSQSTSLAGTKQGSIVALAQLKNIAGKSRRVFTSQSAETFEQFLQKIERNSPGLAIAIVAKLNESTKKQPERLSTIVKSFERYKGHFFKDLLNCLTCEQLDNVTKELSELNISPEGFDNFTESISLVPPEVRQLIITSLLSNKLPKNGVAEMQLTSLQGNLVLFVGIKDKFEKALVALARPSALGKKRSGLDHLSSISKNTPFNLIPTLLDALSSYSHFDLDSQRAQSLRGSLGALGNYFGANNSVHMHSQAVVSSYRNCVDIVANLIQKYPDHHEQIFQVMTSICSSHTLSEEYASDVTASSNSLAQLEHALYRWLDCEKFPRIIFGKTIVGLASEHTELNSALDKVQFLQVGRFTDLEVWQVESVLERLASVPEQRKDQNEKRLISDHLESWVATTLKTLNRNGMQQPAFQQWLLGEHTGLKPFLNAYGHRPTGEKLSDIITNLEQFYIHAITENTAKQAEAKPIKVFDENAFWAKSGWRSRRVLNVIVPLFRSVGTDESKEVLNVIAGSAKNFFRIYREAKALNSDSRSEPSRFELDEAEKRYSQVIHSLNSSHTRSGWILSHLSAAYAAQVSEETTFNQFRASLLKLVGKISRLLSVASTRKIQDEVSNFIQTEIERNYSLDNLNPIFDAIDSNQTQNALNAIVYFLAPRTNADKKQKLTDNDVKVALRCAETIRHKLEVKAPPYELIKTIQSLSSKFDSEIILPIFESMLGLYADSKDTNYLKDILTCLDSHKISINNLNQHRKKILHLQKSLVNFSDNENLEILSHIVKSDILENRSQAEVEDLGRIVSDLRSSNVNLTSIQKIVDLVSLYQKKLPLVDVTSVSLEWVKAYPVEYSGNVIEVLRLMLHSFQKNSPDKITYDQALAIPRVVKLADLESFSDWFLASQTHSAQSTLQTIHDTKTLPLEWSILKKFGAFTEWELLATSNLRQSIGGNSILYSGLITPIALSKNYSIDIQSPPPVFRPNINVGLISEFRDSVKPIQKPKSKKDCTNLDAVRSWCADKIVDYRWKLVTRRDLDDRAEHVTSLLEGLSFFRQKSELKETLVQAVVKLAPVWSSETINKESIALFTKDDLRNAFIRFNLEALNNLIDDVLDYAIKVTSSKSLAYFHRNRDRFDISNDEISEVLDQFALLVGRKKSKPTTLSAHSDIVVTAPTDLSTRLQSAYTPASQEGDPKVSGFNTPSAKEILEIQMRRKINTSRDNEPVSDKIDIENVMFLIASDLRLIVSRGKRDLYDFAKLIEDSLPLFLYQVQERRFPAVVSRFIYQELPQILSIESDKQQSKFSRIPCGLILEGDSTSAIKDQEFLLQLQNLLADRIGIIPLVKNSQIHQEQTTESKTFSSLTSDIDQKIAEIMYLYWYRNFEELDTVREVIFDTLEELKVSPIGYESTLTGSIGALINEEYSNFSKCLSKALSAPNVSCVVYLKWAANDYIRKIKKDLQDADVLESDLFNSSVKRLKGTLANIETTLNDLGVNLKHNQSIVVKVSELAPELKSALFEHFNDHMTESKRKKSEKNARIFLISDQESDYPIMLVRQTAKGIEPLSIASPVLLGRNKKVLSDLFRELSRQYK